MAVFFSGSTAYAVNGTFTWNGDAITSNDYSSDGPVTFTGGGNTYTADTRQIPIGSTNTNPSRCSYKTTITVDANNRSVGNVDDLYTGNIDISLCPRDYPGKQGSIQIGGAPAAAPAAINYATVNCGDGNANGGDQGKCDSIKKCINDTHKPQSDCVSAYDTCIGNHSNGGVISDADKQNCQQLVAAGKLDDANKAPDQNKTSCAIQGIGWLVCPITNFVAKGVDAAYSFISYLLTLQPLNVVPGPDNGLYNGWQIMRNFANVAFVIAFLVIIFSQVTSVGITNYGIKKMLPRLIVAAVLVNVSYWVCAIAVDLSNILGSSMNGLFQSIKDGIPLPAASATSATGDGWAGIASVVLAGTIAGGVALFVGLSALLPMLLFVGLTILTVFLILTLRQALVILLVVISPLAFVAYLLPNTEGLFKKWRQLFQTLLLMYPIIGLMFGASALASKILMTSAGDNYPIKIAAAGMSIIPLVLSYTFMKTATNILGKVGAYVNNPNRGLYDRARKKAQGYAGYRKNVAQARRLQGTNMFKATGARISGNSTNKFRRATGSIFKAAGTPGAIGSLSARAALTQELKQANAEKAVSQTKQEYVANRVAGEMQANNGQSAYAQTIAGPTGNAAKIQAAAVAAQRAEMAEAVKNSQTTMRAEIPPGNLEEVGKRLADAIRENDGIKAQAAQNILMTSGGKGLTQYRDTMTAIGKENAAYMENQASTDMRRNILENHGSVKGSAADFIAQASSGKTMGEASNDPGTWKISDSEMVRQKGPSIELAIKSGGLDQAQAKRIIGNEELAQHLPSEEIREKVRQVAQQGADQAVDTRPTPSPEEIKVIHEEADVQNRLYDMDRGSNRGNPPSPPPPPQV